VKPKGNACGARSGDELSKGHATKYWKIQGSRDHSSHCCSSSFGSGGPSISRIR
jgi:hypothetical protein